MYFANQRQSLKREKLANIYKRLQPLINAYNHLIYKLLKIWLT